MTKIYSRFLLTLGALTLLFGASACDGLYRDLDEIKYDPGDADEGAGADVNDGDPGGGGEEDVGDDADEGDTDGDDCDGACAIGEACHVDSDCAEGTCLDNTCSLCDINQTPFGGGEGAQDDPYLLCSPVHVDNIREELDAHFQLEKDIDMAPLDGFKPIGGSFNFRGYLDGNGRKISNLEIESSADRVGFFSGIDRGSAVINLSLEELSVTGHEARQVGGLAGYFDGGLVQGVNISGQIVEASGEVYDNSAVGGIIGWSVGDGEIKESSCDCEIRGGQRVGGLVGANQNGKIYDSNSSGEVRGSSGLVGGLVGENSGLITGSTSSVNIIVSDEEENLVGYNVGGLVGLNSPNGLIQESHATGDVEASYQVGGFVGANQGEISNNTSAAGKVTGIEVVGGFAGSNTGSIQGALATGAVTGEIFYIGGFVGYHHEDGLIQGSEAKGTVKGGHILGGFVGGLLDNAKIVDSEATGQVAGGEGVGGFAGLNAHEVIDCRAEGSVSGVTGVGGLIGENRGIIERSRASSNISMAPSAADAANFGGLVGLNSGEISSSMATGEVRAAQATRIGGLVGLHSGGGAKLEASFVNSALVEGFSEVGGLVGMTDGGNTTEAEVRASYALVADIRYSSGSAGGLVAKVLSTKLEETYSQVRTIEGSPQASNTAGRLVGSDEYIGVCSAAWGGLYLDSYWSTLTRCPSCCAPDKDPGTDLSPEEFGDKESFNGWDFIDTWEMSQEEKRPVLKWELE